MQYPSNYIEAVSALQGKWRVANDTRSFAINEDSIINATGYLDSFGQPINYDIQYRIVKNNASGFWEILCPEIFCDLRVKIIQWDESGFITELFPTLGRNFTTSDMKPLTGMVRIKYLKTI